MRFILFLILILCYSNIWTQRGKNGTFTISSNTIVNEYTALSSNASIGATSINVVNANLNANNRFPLDLATGDLILIIQMQGVSVDAAPNTLQFGAITNYNNCGNYEFCEVSSVPNNSTINILCGLKNNYTATGKTQIVRIPRYQNLTLTAQLNGQPWNGATGGVISMEVLDDITISNTGSVNATGIGFRGGVEDYATTGFGTWNVALTNPDGGGVKGEGIFGYNADYTPIGGQYAYGAVANGGGGANNHNAGGGGGANAGNIANWNTGVGVPNPIYNTAWNLESPSMVGIVSSGGGRGGYTLSSNVSNPNVNGPNNYGAWSGDGRRPVGGLGGRPLDYTQNKLFLGGGGGSGDANDNINAGGHGGNGGGLIFIKSYGNVSGNGTIVSNGNNGVNLTTVSPPLFQLGGIDGAGGAGAGGTIIIESTGTISGIAFSANGGNGGNQVLQGGAFYGGGLNDATGPGGGGGGGYIALSNNPATSITVNGGNAGTTNATTMNNFPVNGATNAGIGIVNTTLTSFDIIAQNDTICSGTSTTLIANIVGTLPTGSSIVWLDAPNGNFVGAGSSFTTNNLFSDTTFYISVCPGHFSIPVSVIMGVSFLVDLDNLQINNENCNLQDGSITGIQILGGAAPITYEWNNVVTVSSDNPNLAAGSYSLFVADANGCGNTYGPFIVGENLGPNIDASLLTTNDEHCNLSNGSISGISIAGEAPFSYSFNGISSPTASPIGLSAGTYNFSVTDAFGCTSTLNGITIAEAPELYIDSSALIISIATCNQNNGAINGLAINGGNGPYTYQWNGQTTSTLNIQNISSGIYTLTITDSFGCAATSRTINVGSGGFPIAGFTITSNPTILGDTTFITNTASNDVVSWSYYADNGFNFNASDTFAIFPNRGTYIICQVVTNNFGCEDSICIPLSINEPNQEVQLPLPNILTANNDGINDAFSIIGNNNNHSIMIFNRWGQIVFEASPYLNNWNGIQPNGNKLPEGTYYFILQSLVHSEKTYTGHIQLVR